MKSKIQVDITLDDGSPSIYSTHDSIKGHVRLSFKEDVAVDDVTITLQGKSTVRVEKLVAVSSRAGYVFGDHTFLRMAYPTKTLPGNRLGLKGESYIIPFSFIVPEALLPYACSHDALDDTVVREAHLLLPPSLGPFKSAGIDVDDLGPKRVKVCYSIHARLRTAVNGTDSVRVEEVLPVRIFPARNTVLPASIEVSESCYRQRQEKNVCRDPLSFWKSVGSLVAETTPLSLVKSLHPQTTPGSHRPLEATLTLRFDPANEGEFPPKLGAIQSKLHSFTFFGATPFDMIPRPGDACEDSSYFSHFMNTTRLGSCNPGDVVWTKIRESNVKTMSRPESHTLKSASVVASQVSSPSSLNEDERSIYTTTFQIPIRLPPHAPKSSKQTEFPPTFHSCLVARSYCVEIKIPFKGVSAGSESAADAMTGSASNPHVLRPWSHLTLRTPLQISVETGTSSCQSHPTLQSHVLDLQQDEQVVDLIGKPQPRSSAQLLDADSDSSRFRLNLDMSGNLGVEEPPPAYEPTLRFGRH